MRDTPGPLRGRGASHNPANRFETLHYERDPDAAPGEDPAPATQFYRDSTCSIITTNDSPDVGFSASINPYRGCEHGCSYCVSGDTPILMGDGTTRAMAEIKVGDEIYGTQREGWYRRYVKTQVLDHWCLTRPAHRICLADGTCLTVGSDHRFLTERGWRYITGAEQGRLRRPHLTTGNKLMGTGAFTDPPQKDSTYRVGYLCGVIRGDALIGFYCYSGRRRGHDVQHHFRLAMVDGQALERTTQYLREYDIAVHDYLFQAATETRKALRASRTNCRRHVGSIRRLIEWPRQPSEGWYKGFLAGIFDAEGAYRDGTIRIGNTDADIIKRITAGLKRLHFSWVIEYREQERAKPVTVVRICGGLREHLRFFHTTDPVISRKRTIDGQVVKSAAELNVVAVEPLGRDTVLFDMTTGTGDYISNGVVSHNCYARPYHEYLGFSAGIDFESKIMVKEDAPKLLRRELASQHWQPQVLGLSGVTDAYQPIERHLLLTRRCLEVLVQFRNPVAIVTKNHLITRDIDLLRNLAEHHAALACISVTTLDDKLAGCMEPRATRPRGRLDAIRALSAAGIPVMVLVAPIIPGLTDHEIPSILAAAREAGAVHAGYVMLRLPYGLPEIFGQWLADHYPQRHDRVFSRLREVRGNRDNDARFGLRMRGEGPIADAIETLFRMTVKKLGFPGKPALSIEAFRRPDETPPLLFD